MAKAKVVPSLNIHPLASLTPMMSTEQIDALAQDIKKNGQRMPVTLYEGRVLDGRARVAACIKAGIEVKTSVLTTGIAPRAFIYSANVHRRQLEGLELARIAVAYKNDTGKGQKLTVAEVCELFGCSNKTVSLLSTALESGDKELVALAESADTTRAALRTALTAKGLAKEPSKKEEEALVLGEDGKLRSAAEDKALEAMLGTGKAGTTTGNTSTTPAAQQRASEPVTGTGNAASKAARHAPSQASVTHTAEMGKLVERLACCTAQDLEAFFKQAVQRNVWARLKKVEAEHEATKAIGKASKSSKKKAPATTK